MKQEKKQKRVQNTRKKEESLFYSVEVRDKKGRVIQRISAPSRSYVEQWNQLLNLQASQVNKTVKDTGGVDRTVEPSSATLRGKGVAGYTVLGIVVGKGTTAVAITDYALESLCGEGTGLNEFNYEAGSLTAPAVVGSTCSFTTKRIMVNNSGATISGIKEIGCYINCYKTPTDYYVLGFRDVLPSAVYVPHGGSITVTYTIAVTV